MTLETLPKNSQPSSGKFRANGGGVFADAGNLAKSPIATVYKNRRRYNIGRAIRQFDPRTPQSGMGGETAQVIDEAERRLRRTQTDRGRLAVKRTKRTADTRIHGLTMSDARGVALETRLPRQIRLQQNLIAKFRPLPLVLNRNQDQVAVT
jgi:hypothetical protein